MPFQRRLPKTRRRKKAAVSRKRGIARGGAPPTKRRKVETGSVDTGTQTDYELPAAFICPITQDVMAYPVVADDGQSYERHAIEAWIRAHGTSPVTREAMMLEGLHPNRALRDMIAAEAESRPDVAARLEEARRDADEAPGVAGPAAAPAAAPPPAVPAVPAAPVPLVAAHPVGREGDPLVDGIEAGSRLEQLLAHVPAAARAAADNADDRATTAFNDLHARLPVIDWGLRVDANAVHDRVVPDRDDLSTPAARVTALQAERARVVLEADALEAERRTAALERLWTTNARQVAGRQRALDEAGGVRAPLIIPGLPAGEDRLAALGTELHAQVDAVGAAPMDQDMVREDARTHPAEVAPGVRGALNHWTPAGNQWLGDMSDLGGDLGAAALLWATTEALLTALPQDSHFVGAHAPHGAPEVETMRELVTATHAQIAENVRILEAIAAQRRATLADPPGLFGRMRGFVGFGGGRRRKGKVSARGRKKASKRAVRPPKRKATMVGARRRRRLEKRTRRRRRASGN
jgi:hypothetical protein